MYTRDIYSFLPLSTFLSHWSLSTPSIFLSPLALRQALLEGNEEKALEIYLSVSKGRSTNNLYDFIQLTFVLALILGCFLFAIGNKILSDDLQPSVSFPITKYADQTPLHLAAISGNYST